MGGHFHNPIALPSNKELTVHTLGGRGGSTEGGPCGLHRRGAVWAPQKGGRVGSTANLDAVDSCQ